MYTNIHRAKNHARPSGQSGLPVEHVDVVIPKFANNKRLDCSEISFQETHAASTREAVCEVARGGICVALGKTEHYPTMDTAVNSR
jgi:hypothetical protein